MDFGRQHLDCAVDFAFAMYLRLRGAVFFFDITRDIKRDEAHLGNLGKY